jgi:hypothetical protein
MAKYNTYDIMPIAMLGVKNYKLFFDIVEELDRPLGELLNRYVHPKSISGVLTALLAMGVYPIQLYKGRIREPEADIIKFFVCCAFDNFIALESIDDDDLQEIEGKVVNYDKLMLKDTDFHKYYDLDEEKQDCKLKNGHL